MQRHGEPEEFADNWEIICEHGPYVVETPSPQPPQSSSSITEDGLLRHHAVEQLLFKDVTHRFVKEGRPHTGNAAGRAVHCIFHASLRPICQACKASHYV